MQRSLYATVSATIFGLVALAHLYRAAMAIPALAGSTAIPVWWSWVVAVATAALCVWGFRSRA
jgi:hypothetical protein